MFYQRVFAKCFLVIGLFTCGEVRGDVIYLVDFGSSETTSNWINAIAPGSGGLLGDGDDLSDLTDFTTGTGTGASLTGSNFLGGTAGGTGSFARGWVTSNAASQSIAGTIAGGDAQLVFSGLDNSLSYQLDILSSSGDDDLLISDFQANGNFADRTDTGVTTGVGASGNVGDDWRPFLDGSDMEDWMIWNSLTAAGGVITIDIQPESGSRAQINALRLVGTSAGAAAVPEPRTLALTAFLFSVLVFRLPSTRKRRVESAE